LGLAWIWQIRKREHLHADCLQTHLASQQEKHVRKMKMYLLCSAGMGNGAKPASSRPIPSDAELEEALRQVRLDALLSRASPSSSGNSSNGSGAAIGLECMADWAGILSLGEQQRLAFAR
jgi:hypothetical protein